MSQKKKRRSGLPDPLSQDDSGFQFTDYWNDLLPEDDPVRDAYIPDAPAPDRGGLTANEAEYFTAIIAELASRDQEALELYEPLPEQERFHASRAGERLVIGGNRGGKTLSSMVELARALTGKDPHGKYSARGGVAIAVGKDLRHCAKVFYELLFRPGAFKVIVDPDTGRIRSYRPGSPWDEANKALARPAPPLIPHRFYREKDISWDNKREGIIKSIKIHATGWVLNFFSSLGKPPQGWKASLVVFDEEIEHPQWYTEVSARLPDFRVDYDDGSFINGRFFWGATPQAGTVHLYEMSEKADLCKDDPDPKIQKFFISLLDNPHISQIAKDDLMQKLVHNEDEYNVRILGHFAIQGSRVFPEFFPKTTHGCTCFQIPDHWTRYMFLDPGRQVCAALFVAVPPPNAPFFVLPDDSIIKVAGRKFIYDEIYIKRSNASIFALALKKKLATGPPIQEWWIDYHGGKVSDAGTGLSLEQQFAKALKKVNVRSEKNGHTFTWSDGSDVKSGILAVRELMHIDADGITGMVVMHEKVPNLLIEAKNYVYKKVNGTNICTDDPWQRANHLMDCLRYFATARLRYIKPKVKPLKRDSPMHLLAEKNARLKAKNKVESGGGGINLW